jgi:hypothetical protein
LFLPEAGVQRIFRLVPGSLWFQVHFWIFDFVLEETDVKNAGAGLVTNIPPNPARCFSDRQPYPQNAIG